MRKAMQATSVLLRIGATVPAAPEFRLRASSMSDSVMEGRSSLLCGFLGIPIPSSRLPSALHPMRDLLAGVAEESPVVP
jgi:hypothetical protein